MPLSVTEDAMRFWGVSARSIDIVSSKYHSEVKQTFVKGGILNEEYLADETGKKIYAWSEIGPALSEIANKARIHFLGAKPIPQFTYNDILAISGEETPILQLASTSAGIGTFSLFDFYDIAANYWGGNVRNPGSKDADKANRLRQKMIARPNETIAVLAEEVIQETQIGDRVTIGPSPIDQHVKDIFTKAGYKFDEVTGALIPPVKKEDASKVDEKEIAKAEPELSDEGKRIIAEYKKFKKDVLGDEGQAEIDAAKKAEEARAKKVLEGILDPAKKAEEDRKAKEAADRAGKLAEIDLIREQRAALDAAEKRRLQAEIDAKKDNTAKTLLDIIKETNEENRKIKEGADQFVKDLFSKPLETIGDLGKEITDSIGVFFADIIKFFDVTPGKIVEGVAIREEAAQIIAAKKVEKEITKLG